MNSNYNICVLTATRAEYGLLRWIMQEIKDDSGLNLQVLVTGTHMDEKFGNTYENIIEDGFTINAQIPMQTGNGTDEDVVRSIGTLTGDLIRPLKELNPDCLVIMGDRFELLSVASACLVLKIPIAHISGGEITEGAFDNQIRHGVTKMANIHFAANNEYADRILQMGEEEWRVIVSGEPGLDNMTRLTFMNREALSEDLGLDLERPTALVTFHPATLDGDGSDQIDQLMRALETFSLQYIFTYPNADPGNNFIREAMDAFVQRNQGRAKAFTSLGQLRYLSALNCVSMVIGNSSSGIVEAPSFNVPVVNIGNRQKGRMCAQNVVHTDNESGAICKGIEWALAYDKAECVNPYGRGNASSTVVRSIKNILKDKNRQEILMKKFRDLAYA